MFFKKVTLNPIYLSSLIETHAHSPAGAHEWNESSYIDYRFNQKQFKYFFFLLFAMRLLVRFVFFLYPCVFSIFHTRFCSTMAFLNDKLTAITKAREQSWIQ